MSDDAAPIPPSEQWWDFLIWYRRAVGPLLAARRFRMSMLLLQRQAGESAGSLADVSQALLALAAAPPPEAEKERERASEGEH